jgi:hypothetical protein
MTIVIKKASGGVAVMRLIGDADAAACIKQWKAANPGEYVAHAEVAENALPQDRSSRASWTLVDGAVVVPTSLMATEVQAQSTVAIQTLLDSAAKAQGYDNILSVISYADSAVPEWAAEAQACKAWRDACWSKAKEIQDAVLAGTRALPTVEEVLAEMPTLVWPA